jgi:anti-sigma regulatory factor (Ser/Thr protein kinase)
MTVGSWVNASVPGGTCVARWSIGDGHAMREVRALVAAGAHGADDPSLVTSAARRIELVFSELVSNALRHAGAPVHVALFRRPDGRWLIDVADGSPSPPSPREPGRFDLGGRGLMIIARLSGRHGWTVEDGVKHVWAEVA